MPAFLIYIGLLLGLIIFIRLGISSQHFEGADGYPTHSW